MTARLDLQPNWDVRWRLCRLRWPSLAAHQLGRDRAVRTRRQAELPPPVRQLQLEHGSRRARSRLQSCRVDRVREDEAQATRTRARPSCARRVSGCGAKLRPSSDPGGVHPVSVEIGRSARRSPYPWGVSQSPSERAEPSR